MLSSGSVPADDDDDRGRRINYGFVRVKRLYTIALHGPLHQWACVVEYDPNCLTAVEMRSVPSSRIVVCFV